jgi:hypothetical protein
MTLKNCSSRVVRAMECQCQRSNNPGFNPGIFQQSGILGATDEAVLNKVRENAGRNGCKKIILVKKKSTS